MVSPARLYVAYKKDLAAAWNYYRSKHPDHTSYAFVLWGIESPIQFTLHVLTDQGLEQVAKRYLRDGHHETLNEATESLRFSVSDSPFFNELLKAMPTVDALLKPHVSKFSDRDGYRLQAKAAIRALKVLDKQKLFGVGNDRNRIMLCIITEDTQEEWFERSARALNPKAALKHLPKKPEGRFTSSEALALARDGKSLYTTGSDQHIRTITAYSLRKTTLQGRWAYLFPGFGDSARDVECAPDRKTIVALRVQIDDEDRTSILMRFRSDSETPIAEHRFPGVANSIAISHDGSRIAVSMHKSRVIIFDKNFRPILVKPIANAWKLVFLRSGRLLVASDGAIHCLAAKTFKTLKILRFKTRHISVDAAERRMVVSRWPSMNEILSSGKKKSFAIHIFSLPLLRKIRTIDIKDHQATKAVISPDGKLVAFEIRRFESFIRRVIIMETATGREVVRKRVGIVHEMLFLPDSRTLAIGVSEITTGNPIEFWRLPKRR